MEGSSTQGESPIPYSGRFSRQLAARGQQQQERHAQGETVAAAGDISGHDDNSGQRGAFEFAPGLGWAGEVRSANPADGGFYGPSSSRGRGYGPDPQYFRQDFKHDFYPPEGQFVEGASGPPYWQHGGHGGVGKFGRKAPPWRNQPDHREDPKSTTTVTPPAAAPSLIEEAAATVTALGKVKIPISVTTENKDTARDKGSEKSEISRANKAARKKEKLTCYRCGDSGHFAIDCMAELCEICRKPRHLSDACPLLSAPKPVIAIYGVCSDKLMFFETPSMVDVKPNLEGSRFVLVKVTHGVLTVEQVVQQLRRLVSGSFNWTTVKVED
ncbi:hypothetical protein D1007_19584 [Hordeum vulgare]|nr:hypothetical protein D1007_19584 [Hordeum vulgare]